MSQRHLVFLLLALALCGAQAHEADHERARAAMAAGEVMPLQQLLREVATQAAGEVLEVELEREDGRWLYELKLLQPGGRLRKLKVDARTGRLLEKGSGR